MRKENLTLCDLKKHGVPNIVPELVQWDIEFIVLHFALLGEIQILKYMDSKKSDSGPPPKSPRKEEKKPVSLNR